MKLTLFSVFLDVLFLAYVNFATLRIVDYRSIPASSSCHSFDGRLSLQRVLFVRICHGKGKECDKDVMTG